MKGISIIWLSRIPLTGVIGLMWCICWIAVIFIPALSSWVGLAALLLTYWLTAKNARYLFLLSLPFITLRIAELVAGIVICSGATMRELGGAVGVQSSAFFYLAAMYALWPMASLWFGRNSVDSNPEVPHFSGLSCQIAMAVVVCYILAIYTFYLRYGFPLLNGVDKFAFASANGGRFFLILQRYRIAIVMMIALLSATGRYVRLGSALFFAIFVAAILGSDKVTGPLMLVTAYMGTYLAVTGKKFNFSIFKTVAVLVLLGSIGFGYLYSRIASAGSLQLALYSVMVRVPAQGQVWYTACERKTVLMDFDRDQVHAEVQSLFSSEAATDFKNPTGQWYVMLSLLSPEDLRKFMITGTGLIMMLYGYILSAYGVIPVIIFNALYLLYFLFVASNLYYFFRRGMIVASCISCFIISSQINSSVTGNLSAMLGSYSMICMAIIVFVRLSVTRKALSA